MSLLDEIAARANAATEFFSEEHDVMPAVYEDRGKLVAALRDVEAVVDMWEVSYKQVQGILAARDDLDTATRNEMSGGAESTRVGINQIRTAIREALG